MNYKIHKNLFGEPEIYRSCFRCNGSGFDSAVFSESSRPCPVCHGESRFAKRKTAYHITL